MVQMAQQTSSTLEKDDEEVEQFKKEVEQSYHGSLREQFAAYDTVRSRRDLWNRYDASCVVNSQRIDRGIAERPDQQAPTTQHYATPPTRRRLVVGNVAYASGASQSPNLSLGASVGNIQSLEGRRRRACQGRTSTMTMLFEDERELQQVDLPLVAPPWREYLEWVQGDGGGDGSAGDETRLESHAVHSDDGGYGRGRRLGKQTLRVKKQDLLVWVHLHKATRVKQIWEMWSTGVGLAMSTWSDVIVTFWLRTAVRMKYGESLVW